MATPSDPSTSTASAASSADNTEGEKEYDHLRLYYPYYLAAIIFVFFIGAIVMTVRKMKKIRLVKLRTGWNCRGKVVVTLHMFDRAVTGPNPSPYPIKLETYLRMMDIKSVHFFEYLFPPNVISTP